MNLLLTFTNRVSLKEWDHRGILDREILLYNKISQNGIKVKFLTYGDKSDLNYSDILKNIKVSLIKDSKFLSFFKILLFPLFNYKIFKKIDIIKTNQMGGICINWLLKLIYRKKVIVRSGYENLKAISIVESPAFFRRRKIFVLENFLYRA